MNTEEGVGTLLLSKPIDGFNWWHVIEVASGVVTGWRDLRHTAERMP